MFNLVARERVSETLGKVVSETLGKVKEKFHQAATGIATGVAGALGAGVAQSLDMSAANAKLTAQLGVARPGRRSCPRPWRTSTWALGATPRRP